MRVIVRELEGNDDWEFEWCLDGLSRATVACYCCPKRNPTWDGEEKVRLEINKRVGTISMLLKPDVEASNFIGHLPDEHPVRLNRGPFNNREPRTTPRYEEELGFTRALISIQANSFDRAVNGGDITVLCRFKDWKDYKRDPSINEMHRTPFSLWCWTAHGRPKQIKGEWVKVESRTHGGQVLNSNIEIAPGRNDFSVTYGYDDTRVSNHGFGSCWEVIEQIKERGIPYVRYTSYQNWVRKLEKNTRGRPKGPRFNKTMGRNAGLTHSFALLLSNHRVAEYMVSQGRVPYGVYFVNSGRKGRPDAEEYDADYEKLLDEVLEYGLPN